MEKRVTCLVAALILVLVIGCQGGRQGLPVSESSAESTEPFIFAESSLMDIDSDMMAMKIATMQLPGGAVRLDSATAMRAVYSILADTFLTREAESFDLEEESPMLYRQYLDLRRDRVLREMYMQIIAESVTVSDSVARAFYEDRKESFFVPDRYRARHIVISGEGLRYSDDSLVYKDMTAAERDSAAHQQTEDLRRRLLAGENFDTLAMLYSQDENTRAVGGDLGFFQLEQMVPPFDSTVEHTEIGDISGVIKTQYGWHVVKVIEVDSAHYLPFDSVSGQINESLTQEMMMIRARHFIDSLRDDADIVFDTAALNMPDSLHEGKDVMAYLIPDDTSAAPDTLYFTDYKRQVPGYRRQYNIQGELSFDAKQDILLNAAVQPLLMRAAEKLGFMEYPEIVEWSEGKLRQYSLSVLRGRLLDSVPEPTEEEIKQYYDAHIDEYQIERPVSVQHIVFEDSAVAEHVRDLLRSGVDFMEMVDQYYPGDPDIKRAAADLGAIGPNDMPTPFYQAALTTPVGGISHPVKTTYGYHLIKVLDRTHSVEFEQAKIKIIPKLKQHFQREALREYVESHLDSPPKIHWEYVERLSFPKPRSSMGSRPLPPGADE